MDQLAQNNKQEHMNNHDLGTPLPMQQPPDEPPRQSKAAGNKRRTWTVIGIAFLLTVTIPVAGSLLFGGLWSLVTGTSRPSGVDGSYPELGFSAVFPSTPNRTLRKDYVPGGTNDFHIVKAEGPGYWYEVSTSRSAESEQRAISGYPGWLDGTIAHPASNDYVFKAQKKQDITIDGHTALTAELVIQAPSPEAGGIRHIALLVTGGHEYQISSKGSAEEWETFLHSIRFSAAPPQQNNT